MRVLFRVDASLSIGTGHVMRCLTLANALAAGGAECVFLCRVQQGDMIKAVRSNGFTVHALPRATKPSRREFEKALKPPHAAWLTTSWQHDADETREYIQTLGIDWLVVDHYALDKCWEDKALTEGCRLLVIDDLADREHSCHLLLDQNLGRLESDYTSLVPQDCTCLIGAKYALLRPEFEAIRKHSLARRESPELRHILVSMGGVDKDNATGAVLSALHRCHLGPDCRITVVLGTNSPWREAVISQAKEMPWATEVAINVQNMAQRMLDADLAIGAAGSTSWERCCLGLPTVLVTIAANQVTSALELSSHGAVVYLGDLNAISSRLSSAVNVLCAQPDSLRTLAFNASQVTSGRGVSSLLMAMGVSSDVR